MDSKELVQLMQQIEDRKMDWDAVEKKIKVSHAILGLYARSGPVPVTILKNLRKVLEEPAQ